MSISHYVLGIGDRHLSNVMFDTSSGTIVGIDFGHSLGSATVTLPVPEFVPFRLTGQMTGFLHPHSANGLIRVAMVTAMSALHDQRNIILRIMDVFVHEPLAEWESMAKRQHTSGDTDAQIEPNWYPMQKIRTVQQKLDKAHPSMIMTEEAKRNPNFHSHTLAHMVNAIEGDAAVNVRATLGSNTTLTIEQQVDCLIDIATDPNILGHTWEGWEPWM
ncbi:hypothetical protein SARC_06333 [Sphaeroforma arctica JP610]|uniref:Uncharacterized protein n=1 Tax=Sphaeroforma arctica JP610 TaxID=667725 RepID=A0A0L0FZE0_9EUKA|nr:hypothetical protein SARC_06333 [Sphaeroforma arctica JP610]KNC81333.1 hypothetical protein SARC_06333 [Sphaeroforma arctica JP610]|eukprot:XP_014155235.1 hypothetical protein SARC_06333 [Sphaeroforma arctica JP610]